VRRRTALSWIAITSSSITSGCTVFSGNKPNTNTGKQRKLCGVTVANRHSESHDVIIELRNENGVLTSEADQVLNEESRNASFSLKDQLPIEDEELSIWVRMDEGSWQSLQLSKVESRTVSVFVEINPEARLSIFYSSDCLE
jgi:hypothetical protein